MSEHLTNQCFTDLDLPDVLLHGVHNAGFEYLTPIQAEALPILLAGEDVAGQAQTGTGKTAAFLVATFNTLTRDPDAHTAAGRPRTLILAPTRELAIQIHRDAQLLVGDLPLRLALVYGGTGYDEQRRQFESGVDVLIGTPGRIIDYFKQGVFKLDGIEVMVLDEADRMFDLGFIRDIRFLLRRMPPPEKRLNMLFSATLSLRVNELAYEHMNNPRVIKIESEHLTVDNVDEVVYFPANSEKIPLLISLLKQDGLTRTLIFVNTKHVSEEVSAWLTGNGLKNGVLSGDVPQNKRERLLHEFTRGELPILVATDVAARGLHIPEVSHVVNYDLPQDPEDYVHRVGRTARAGASGDAISFACETYAFSLLDIEQYIGHKIPVAAAPPEAMIRPEPPAPINRERRRERDAGHSGRRSKSPERPRGRRQDQGARRAEGAGRSRPSQEPATARPPQPRRHRETARSAGDGRPGDTAAPARPKPVEILRETARSAGDDGPEDTATPARPRSVEIPAVG